MKRKLIFFAALLVFVQQMGAQCINGISTNPDNPVNSQFPEIHTFLNNFDWGENNGFTFADISLNLNAGWNTALTQPSLSGTGSYWMYNPFADNSLSPYLRTPQKSIPNP